MIYSYIVTQVTLAMIQRNFNSTDARLFEVERYSLAMLVERARQQPFTDEVTDLDELAITFMVDLIKKSQLMNADALANEAYTLALGGIRIAEKYEKAWHDANETLACDT